MHQKIATLLDQYNIAEGTRAFLLKTHQLFINGSSLPPLKANDSQSMSPLPANSSVILPRVAQPISTVLWMLPKQLLLSAIGHK